MSAANTTIPDPPVGHWTKIKVGHKITPPPLVPELSRNEAVHIYVRERLSPELIALAAEPPPEVNIPKELSHVLALRRRSFSHPARRTRENSSPWLSMENP
jgi:hypothetical protein